MKGAFASLPVEGMTPAQAVEVLDRALDYARLTRPEMLEALAAVTVLRRYLAGDADAPENKTKPTYLSKEEQSHEP